MANVNYFDHQRLIRGIVGANLTNSHQWWKRFVLEIAEIKSSVSNFTPNNSQEPISWSAYSPLLTYASDRPNTRTQTYFYLRHTILWVNEWKNNYWRRPPITSSVQESKCQWTSWMPFSQGNSRDSIWCCARCKWQQQPSLFSCGLTAIIGFHFRT